MAAVTQVIPNYIGGVSSQPDERKLPGQVTEATNVYIDPTFGLTKRQGLQFLTTLDTYNDDADPLDGASWFVITRDDDEAYFGCVVDGGIRIWNLFLLLLLVSQSLLNVLLLVIMLII